VIGESGEARLIVHGNVLTLPFVTIAERYFEAHLQVRSRYCSVLFRKIDKALNSFRSRRGLPRRGDLFHLTFEVPIFCSGKHPPLSEQT
jgi:hypothetical protein